MPGKERLKLLTWNLKFGGARIDFFIDGHGDRVLMTSEEVLTNLDAIAEAINSIDPDVLFVQEIDRFSRRVAGIDQFELLFEKTRFRYAAFSSQWRSTYIPSRGIGPVNMGNGIFAKYPLKDVQRLSLPPISEQDELTRYFYLKRNIMVGTMEVPGFEELTLVNCHAAAFAQDNTKEKHLGLLFSELKRINRSGRMFVLGADLNAVPPDTKILRDFEDVASLPGAQRAAFYEGEAHLLEPFYECFYEAISHQDYKLDQCRHFTHSTRGTVFWNRKLDYLFSNRPFVKHSAVTYQDENQGGLPTMGLSDHAPLGAEMNLEKKK